MTAYSPVRISDHAGLRWLIKSLDRSNPEMLPVQHEIMKALLAEGWDEQLVPVYVTELSSEMRPPVSPCDLEFARFNGDVA